MSDTEQPELKGGHPPAMKVGGKRVPLPKHHEEKVEPTVNKEDETAADKEKANHSKTVIISGAQVKEKEIFSPEAAKAIHDKPQPTHSQHPIGYSTSHIHSVNNIQQPRKN